MKKQSYLEELKNGNKTLTDKVSELEEQIKLLKKDNYNLTKENHLLRSNIVSLERDVEHFKQLVNDREDPISKMMELFNKTMT